ncbi:uncharacterized protein DS421_8g236420 [Arachis hypogaea]|nr:uncharacterized protein DS421_8g236420 [Arachis hypogaea]
MHQNNLMITQLFLSLFVVIIIFFLSFPSFSFFLTFLFRHLIVTTTTPPLLSHPLSFFI